MNQPRILTLDIETRPAKVWTFDMFNANFSPEKIIEPGGVLCFGANWLGSKDFLFFSEWEDGHENMIRAAHELLSQADAVVTYHGDGFDLPKLNGEFLLYGLSPPPPLTSIDLLKTVRKFGFAMNRLAYVGPLLSIGNKIKHEGFTLWTEVMDGKKSAQERMKKYCLGDVKLTVDLYNLIKPYIRNHPNLVKTPKGVRECGACGSSKLHSRGYRYTKEFKIQRLQCQSCGGWSDGQRKKV